MRPDIYRMFYPLEEAEQKEWAEIVRLPVEQYEEHLREKAEDFECTQVKQDGCVVWLGKAGNPELMLFRIPDPGNLDAIRNMYAAISDANCPIAYAFVNQRGDAVNAWDVFQMSRLSFLCHCNRISGPGAYCEK